VNDPFTVADARALASWHGQEALRLEHAAAIAGALDRTTAQQKRDAAAWHRTIADKLEAHATDMEQLATMLGGV